MADDRADIESILQFAQNLRPHIDDGDFDDDELENIAEVTGEWSRGTVSDDDSATITDSGEEIIVPIIVTPETQPEVVVPIIVMPQAEETTLPQTGQIGTELFYGFGSLLLAAGYVFRNKRKD